MFDESNGARPGLPKILIMLTDGTANLEESNTVSEADLTKAAGIIIYTVGVTHEVDEEQLREIASNPDHFFFASDFAHLNDVLQNLVENSCQEAATLPTTRRMLTTILSVCLCLCLSVCLSLSLSLSLSLCCL